MIMQNQNITMDYSKSVIDNQELAVMPASLAKRLLKLLTNQLIITNVKEIIGNQMDALRKCDTIEESVRVSIEYVNERNIIKYIQADDWDFYKIQFEVKLAEPDTDYSKPDRCEANLDNAGEFDESKYFRNPEMKVVGKIEIPTKVRAVDRNMHE